MASPVPISDKDGVITSGVGEWDRNFGPTQDSDASKPTSGFVERKGREIVKASNLIFHLKFVCVVFSRWDWAVCSINSILVRVFPVLYTAPVFSGSSKIIVIRGLRIKELSRFIRLKVFF